MKEKKFEKVVEGNNNIKEIIFFIFLAILSSILIYLMEGSTKTDYFIIGIIVGIFISMAIILLVYHIFNREVYWREIKE